MGAGVVGQEFGGLPALADHSDADVVIIDDQPANVLLLEKVLRRAGIERVHGLTDPRAVVDRCLEVDADLLLLDLHMPRLGGLEVLGELRRRMPESSFLPVIMLTGDASPTARDQALFAGATDFLVKPFDTGEVLLRVRNLLAARGLHSVVTQHNAELRAELDVREREEREREERRREVLARIDDLIAGGGPDMVFQPIADLRSGRVDGAEALARFRMEPHRPPNVWFDEATAVGRGHDLELAAVRAALAHMHQLPDDVFLAINISPDVVADDVLPELCEGHPTERLVFEITEHAPVADYVPLQTALDRLRERGMRVAIDDAGAGYAGLRHVLSLRPDVLKLDIALTSGIDHDPARRALSTGLVVFADEIGATIVAEGIESCGELQTLRSLGIRYGQGYHLARPAELPLAVIDLDAGRTASDGAPRAG